MRKPSRNPQTSESAGGSSRSRLLLNPERCGIESQAILGILDGTEILEHSLEVLRSPLAPGLQIQIQRGAVRLTFPDGEQRGSFEEELVRVGRKAEAVEE